MRIFLISNMYPSFNSPGYGVFVKNVAEELKQHECEVVSKAVISGRSKGKWDKIRKYLGFYAETIKGFFSDYDLIYIHFPNQVIPLLRILYKFRQPKIVMNFHGEDLLYSKATLHNWLGKSTESFCKKYSTGIVVPSPYFAKIVDSRSLTYKERIVVSPSGGINENYFKPKSRESIEEKINHPIHLGYVGRIDPGKGIVEFLNVLKRMSERRIDYKATIIGYGSLIKQTENFIIDNNLSESTSIIMGVPQSELAVHYRDFNLLVFLSSRAEESLGLTGIESMACGTPVIGSNVGGIASYLEDGKNGYLISNISNTDHIVDVIEEYTQSSKESRLNMYDNAVATGKRYFSSNVCRQLASDLKALTSND